MRTLILSDITEREGHINNSTIYELTWVDIESLKVWTTTVDTAYRNYTRSGWHTVIEQRLLGLYTNLIATVKTDRDRLSVINADSHPQLVEQMREAEIVEVIEQRQQDLQTQGLFEFQ